MKSICKALDSIVGILKTFSTVAITLFLISIPKFITTIFSKAIKWIKGG